MPRPPGQSESRAGGSVRVFPGNLREPPGLNLDLEPAGVGMYILSSAAALTYDYGTWALMGS
jgi:hypothetical protein